MAIRTRLALIFIGLIVFGVTAIASYAILFIREFLTEEGKRQLLQEAAYVAAVASKQSCDGLTEVLANLNRLPSYDARLSGAGQVWAPAAKPWANDSLPHQPGLWQVGRVVYVAARVPAPACPSAQYLRLARPEEDLYAPIRRIRWIIYTGMFLSIGLVMVVSTLTARSIARPIQHLSAAAEAIAQGGEPARLALSRSDEIGQLAQSLQRMAEQLRADAQALEAQALRTQQFYADIAHEVRNPLHTLLGTLELLELPGVSADDRARHYGVLRGQLERLNHLFDDLMTLVRADQDPGFLKPRPLDLAAVAQQLEGTYRPLIEAQGLAFRVEAAPVAAVADPVRLEQILTNLLSNALKFTPAGSITLSVQPTAEGAQVMVADTGVGIAPEHVPHLGERFYRAETSRSRTAGGTGLGLAVVRRLVEAHGGTLAIDSRVGQGTTVTVTFLASL